jgi:hypothetical protein
MPEANEAIMQEVRAKQLHSNQLSDAFGVGKQAPLFEHIEQPCLASQRGSAGSLQASDVQKCSTPAEHLFWFVTHDTNALSQADQIKGMTFNSADRPMH